MLPSQTGWLGAHAWALQLALSASSRQNKPTPHCRSELPAPLPSHLQTAPSLQNLVFGTHTAPTHAPFKQACDDGHVRTRVSLEPAASQIFTLRPSQRLLPATQT